ncbi:MAG: ABC transporter permease subunit [Lentisphaerae bacterium]|jgi:hypothetical protein|nr:ABC transporter permease subunit [Lentisphaerota bacterium]
MNPAAPQNRSSTARVSRLRPLAALAQTTLVESMQQPAVLLLTLAGVVATALIPLLQFHEFGEPGRLARDGALAYQLTLGLALAVVTASAAIRREIASGTASAALSKPLPRDAFVIGKFLGVARMLLRFWYALLAAMLLAERVAYRIPPDAPEPVGTTDIRAQVFLLLVAPVALAIAAVLDNRRRVRFCIAAQRGLLALLTLGLLAALAFDRHGAWNPSPANLDLRIVPVSLLILAVLMPFAALATALSTRLGSGPTLIISGLLLALGLAVDPLLNPANPFPVRLAARLLPNVQSFWLCDALTGGGTVSPAYVAGACVCAAAWCLVMLSLGVLAFRKCDIF